MSLARTISRGAFLRARLGVNGTQKASRSFGTDATGRVASDIGCLLEPLDERPSGRQPIASQAVARKAMCVPDPTGWPDGYSPRRAPDQLPHPVSARSKRKIKITQGVALNFRDFRVPVPT